MEPSTKDTRTGNWFAAMLKPNGLRIAEANLARQGFVHFTPKRLETVRRGDVMRTQPKPLFPGCIFIQSDPKSPRWRSLNSTRGITRMILGERRMPAPLPEDFMAALLMRCDEDGILTAAPSLKAGDVVRVVSGPMADIVSRIEKLHDDQRVQLLMDLMGRETRVFVAAEYLEKLSS